MFFDGEREMELYGSLFFIGNNDLIATCQLLCV